MSRDTQNPRSKIFGAPVRALTVDELKIVSGGATANHKPSQIRIDSAGYFS